MRGLTKQLMLRAWRNKLMAPLVILRTFCGVFVSLGFTLPLALFYPRCMYFEMSRSDRKEKEGGKGNESEGE